MIGMAAMVALSLVINGLRLARAFYAPTAVLYGKAVGFVIEVVSIGR